MIEKIPFETENIHYNDKTLDVQTHASPYDLQIKINELVDAVNELQEFADVADKNLAKLMEDATREEKVQDKFAEQRKWIGCICRFWNDESLEDSMYGELVDICDAPHEDCPFQCGYGEWYAYCEPVKPDDDIIYKGE